MTTSKHTAITTGAAANAATFNAPLSQLDTAIIANAAAIVVNAAAIAGNTAEIVTARSSYTTLDSRLDALTLATGNATTLTNGVTNAGQKVIVVDATTGFLAGAPISYTLISGAVESNVIGTVDGLTQITCVTNVGATGIANNTYVSIMPLGAVLDTGIGVTIPNTLKLANARRRVVCLGDSLSALGGYHRYLATHLDAAVWQVVSGGVGGYTSANILAEWPYYAPLDTAYVCVLGGINGILWGESAATCEANLQATYTALHNAGMKVVAVTLTPWKASTYWEAAEQVVTDAVNTWILNTATNVDYRVDAYTALEDVADTLKAAYDSGDGLHPNDAGYAALATAVYNAVTWTAAAVAPVLTMNNASIVLNQSLTTSDAPTFSSVNANREVRTATIKANNTEKIEIQSSAAAVGMTLDLANKRLGVGVAPLYPLHVNGTSAIIGTLTVGGDAPVAYFGLNVCNETSGLTTQWGVYAHVLASTAATVAQYQIQSTVNIAAATTMATAIGAYITDAVKGGGATIADLYGVRINAQTGGTDYNYGLFIAAPTGATYNWAISADGSCKLAHTAGDVALGNATGKLGFYAVTPITRAVLATGGGATVDNVITALQNLGLVKQS